MIASQNGFCPVVDRLLSVRADVNAKADVTPPPPPSLAPTPCCTLLHRLSSLGASLVAQAVSSGESRVCWKGVAGAWALGAVLEAESEGGLIGVGSTRVGMRQSHPRSRHARKLLRTSPVSKTLPFPAADPGVLFLPVLQAFCPSRRVRV